MMQTAFILKAIKDDNAKVQYIATDDNPSDIGTKDMDIVKFHMHASTLMGCPPTDTSKVGPSGLYN